MRNLPAALIVSSIALVMVACDSSSGPDPIPLEVQRAEDVPADPATGRDPLTGQVISNNLFTLFDIDENRIVLSSSDTDAIQRREDSTGTVWDIGFRGTTIIFNGGSSGPGQAEAQLLMQPFADVLEAPEGGYITDGSNQCPAIQTPVGTVPGSPYAICGGSDNGWYNYNSSTMLIAPIAGRAIVFKTATGKYASLRILSYYKGNPDPPDPNAPSRYYTFEFIFQPDGTRNLQETTVN